MKYNSFLMTAVLFLLSGNLLSLNMENNTFRLILEDLTLVSIQRGCPSIIPVQG